MFPCVPTLDAILGWHSPQNTVQVSCSKNFDPCVISKRWGRYKEDQRCWSSAMLRISRLTFFVYFCCNFYRVYYCSLSIFSSSSLPGCCVQAMGNARQRAAVEMATRLCSQEILRICRLWQMSNVAMISHDSILFFSVQSMKCPGIEAKCCSCWYLACSDSHNHRIDMESSWDWICCQAIAAAVSCCYHFDLLWASPMAKKKCLKKVLARKLLKIQRWKPFELGSRWYFSMESSAAKVGDHQR